MLFFVSLPGYGDERGLYINEIQVANVDMFIDPSYNYGGWIEIYNPTDTATSLNGIVLRHTDAEGVVKTRILTTDNGKVPAGGFKNIWFDHNFADGFYGPYAKGQIPFKMDADGGFIELLKSNGTDIIDPWRDHGSDVFLPFQDVHICASLTALTNGSLLPSLLLRHLTILPLSHGFVWQLLLWIERADCFLTRRNSM